MFVGWSASLSDASQLVSGVSQSAICPSFNLSDGQPSGRLISYFVSCSVSQLVSQSANQFIRWSVSWSVNQPISLSDGQSVGQSISQSVWLGKIKPCTSKLKELVMYQTKRDSLPIKVKENSCLSD